MRVARVQALLHSDVRDADFSFDVEEEALPPFDGPTLTNVAPVARYRKRYSIESEQWTSTATRVVIAAAGASRGVAGYLIASRSWNNCAQIDDFAVDRGQRRAGVGRMLMAEAIAWAREMGLAAVRAETQSNNVAACRFYERLGFSLGGFDRYLYAGLDAPARFETALFWYLSLERQP